MPLYKTSTFLMNWRHELAFKDDPVDPIHGSGLGEWEQLTTEGKVRLHASAEALGGVAVHLVDYVLSSGDFGEGQPALEVSIIYGMAEQCRAHGTELAMVTRAMLEACTLAKFARVQHIPNPNFDTIGLGLLNRKSSRQIADEYPDLSHGHREWVKHRLTPHPTPEAGETPWDFQVRMARVQNFALHFFESYPPARVRIVIFVGASTVMSALTGLQLSGNAARVNVRGRTSIDRQQEPTAFGAYDSVDAACGNVEVWQLRPGMLPVRLTPVEYIDPADLPLYLDSNRIN